MVSRPSGNLVGGSRAQPARLRTWAGGNRVTRHGAFRRRPGPRHSPRPRTGSGGAGSLLTQGEHHDHEAGRTDAARMRAGRLSAVQPGARHPLHPAPPRARIPVGLAGRDRRRGVRPDRLGALPGQPGRRCRAGALAPRVAHGSRGRGPGAGARTVRAARPRGALGVCRHRAGRRSGRAADESRPVAR